LEDDPKYIDEIVLDNDIETSQALTMFLDLEWKGVAVHLSGKQFARA